MRLLNHISAQLQVPLVRHSTIAHVKSASSGPLRLYVPEETHEPTGLTKALGRIASQLDQEASGLLLVHGTTDLPLGHVSLAGAADVATLPFLAGLSLQGHRRLLLGIGEDSPVSANADVVGPSADSLSPWEEVVAKRDALAHLKVFSPAELELVDTKILPKATQLLFEAAGMA